MGKKICIENLPVHTTEDDLTDALSQCGVVRSIRLIADEEKGEGRAIVEMATDEEAADVIQDFNGGTLDGRPMKITEMPLR